MTSKPNIICIVFAFLMSFGSLGFGQNSPFAVSTADVGLGAGVILSAGIGELIQRRVEPFKQVEISALDPQDINRFDRPFAGKWNLSAKKWSDGLAIGLMASPLAMFVMPNERRDFLRIAMMGAEAGLLSYGLVGMGKGIAQRPRPLLYGSDAPLDVQMRKDARRSFFSGHTAFTATALFYGASVFDAYHPYSRWRPLVWGGAIGGSALVGYLRMRAGKHFPTDVIVGYIIGLNAGALIPWLHKRANVKGRVLAFSFSGNAAGFNLSF